MRVEVDTTLCHDTAYCERIVPEVVSVENGLARLLVSEPDVSLNDQVDEAERLCPSRAITL